MFQYYTQNKKSKPSEQVVQDLPDYKELLQKINHQLQTITKPDLIKSDTTNSVCKFLKAKNAWMCHYLIYTYMYILQRISTGEAPSEELQIKLLESRLMVSKMTTVQKKLQYQIDKMLQVGLKEQNLEDQRDATREQDEDYEVDEISYKPRPHMLQSQFAQAEVQDEEEQVTKGKKKPLKYIPPKLASTLSKEDYIAEKIKKQEERRKMYLKRKVQQNLEDEDEDAPKEVTTEMYQKRYYGQEQDRAEKERERFEDEYFMPLQPTKAEKLREKRRQKLIGQEERIDNLSELNNISSLLRMEGLVGDEEDFKAQEKISKLKDKQKSLNRGGKKKFFKLKKTK